MLQCLSCRGICSGKQVSAELQKHSLHSTGSCLRLCITFCSLGNIQDLRLQGLLYESLQAAVWDHDRGRQPLLQRPHELRAAALLQRAPLAVLDQRVYSIIMLPQQAPCISLKGFRTTTLCTLVHAAAAVALQHAPVAVLDQQDHCVIMLPQQAPCGIGQPSAPQG